MTRVAAWFFTRVPWAIALAGLGGCLDIDRIYESGQGAVEDAGRDGSVPDELPAQLIDLWRGQAFVDDACVRCAKSSCRAANDSCRADQDCAALTRCVAESTDPDTQASCRAEHVAWLSESPYQRALGGPFYACVFRDKCAEQCATHTDFSCLGEFSWALTSDASVPVTFQFVNALDSAPADGLDAKVCRSEDLGCVTPAGDSASTDAEGKVTLSLPTPLRSFSGYLDLTGEGWYPTLVHFGYPLTRTGVIYLPVVDRTSVQLNVNASGVEPDPARGLLQIRMFGCAGVGMRDVYFTASASKVDEASRTWYAKPFLPSFEEIATGDLGSGGIINVKPGLTDVVARLRSDDSVVARTQAPVRAGHLTIVVMSPLDAAR